MIWLKNILSNYLRFFTALAVMAVLTPIIIQHIGVESYGTWVIVYALIGIVSLSDLGFATAAIKFLAEAQTNNNDLSRNQITGALVFVYAFLTLFCFSLVLLIYMLELTPRGDIFLLLGAASTIVIGTSVHRAALIANGQQHIVNWIAIAGTLLQALLTYELLQQGWDIEGVALSHFVGTSLQALCCVPIANRLARMTMDFSKIKEYGKHIAKFSCWALIANTSVMIILRVDPLLIEQLASLEAVAVFAIALKIAEQALLLNKQFSNALLPLVSKIQGDALENARAELLVYSTRYLIVFAAPFLGLLAINGGDLIFLWVGADFVAASDSLSLLAIAALFSTMQFNAANINGMSGHPHWVGLSMLLSAIVKIVLSLYFISLYGIVGAAIGTLIASVTCEFTINVYKSCKITAVSIFTFFRRSLLPGILCAIPCLYLASVDEVSASVLDLFVMNVLYGSAAVLLFVCFFVDAADRSFFGKLLLNSESRDAKTNSEVSSKSISATH
ncbi:MAG: polysaccharide biosynthesis C-terminal domain-containing protein [Pseudomonadales bacterium]|nr:polysaccharide biosynthesis C-terminal domain-containing protein [Pseudomonadales bacterium]